MASKEVAFCVGMSRVILAVHFSDEEEFRMGNSRADELGNPHPVSQHRTPDEIAADEAGPIGHPDPDAEVKRVFGESGPRRPAGDRNPEAASAEQKPATGKNG